MIRKYRLSDNYLRFYLKYIVANRERILQGKFENSSLFDTMKWESIMGLQFENLVIHNSNLLLDALHIPRSDCVFDGPFFQTRTNKRKGAQIDYLIQSRNTLYVCEIKFSRNMIGMGVIEDMEKKIETLSVPRLFSCRPILIHVGRVREEVIEKDYFDRIIDWTNFL